MDPTVSISSNDLVNLGPSPNFIYFCGSPRKLPWSRTGTGVKPRDLVRKGTKDQICVTAVRRSLFRAAEMSSGERAAFRRYSGQVRNRYPPPLLGPALSWSSLEDRRRLTQHFFTYRGSGCLGKHSGKPVHVAVLSAAPVSRNKCRASASFEGFSRLRLVFFKEGLFLQVNRDKVLEQASWLLSKIS